MTVQKGNFVEIEFTGKIKDSGEIFDTNIESDAKSAKLDIKNIKPFTLCVGQKMLPPGFDDDLIGKEIEKSYTLELTPEKAFGKRNSSLVRMIPSKLFHEQKISPVKGMQLALDGQLVKILSSDHGRTLVDFNNPLAGKTVVYDYKIKKEITSQNEKVDALQEFLLRKKFEYQIIEGKLIFDVTKEFEPFIKLISPKFEEMIGLKVETKIVEDKKK